ncbi:MAG: sugar transferase [Opitutaceae bacterium]|nr:sugar transferase [Opitutaceae bacterium]
MLTHHRRARIRLLQALDAGLFGGAWCLAYWLRAKFPLWNLSPLEPFPGYLALAPLVMFLGPALLAGRNFYARPRLGSRLAVINAIVRACLFTVIGVILCLFLLRSQLARSVVIMTGLFASVLVYVRAEITRWIEETRMAQDQLRRRVLWVGVPAETARWRDRLAAYERDRLQSVADYDPRGAAAAGFVALLHQHAVNVVIINLAGLAAAEVQPVLAACEREGVETLVRAGIFHSPVFRPEIDHLAGEPVISYRAQAASAGQLLAKRVTDYLGAAVLLVLLLPLYGLIAAAIKLTSPGPVIFRQRRCGLNGRPFAMLKFRSMVSDAEQRKAEVAARNEMKGPVFKVQDDPRVTPVGRFLRRHGLDELPQLWNVLRGEMSLVGPRPLPVEEVHRFEDDAHRRRLSVLPGLTCLWQVSGRNEIDDFAEWVRLDLEYIDHWSLWLDCKILLATVPAVLLGRGGR